MKRPNRILKFLMLLAVVITFNTNARSSPNPDDIVCDELGCISLSKFRSNISNILNSKVVGYVAFIGETPFSFIDYGLARTSADPPSLQMFPTLSINVASVSKVLTTIGVLQSLDRRGLTINAKISPFLYADWVKGPNIDTITFRDLLTHKSGFRMPICGQFTSYAELRAQIANGVTLADKAVASYNNCNFGIFREMLPFMEDWAGVAFYPSEPDTQRAAESAAFYIYYMNLKVFHPIGIASDCKPPLTDHILSYPFSAGAVHGDDFGDFTLKCGAGGWQLSAADLHKILVNLIRGDELLPHFQKELMTHDKLGWDNSVRNDCPDPYPCKNGAFENGANAWVRTYAGIFKCVAPVVLFLNSDVPPPYDPGEDIIGLVKDAYNGAGVPVPPGAPKPKCPP
jgi:hypothetical protein